MATEESYVNPTQMVQPSNVVPHKVAGSAVSVSSAQRVGPKARDVGVAMAQGRARENPSR